MKKKTKIENFSRTTVKTKPILITTFFYNQVTTFSVSAPDLNKPHQCMILSLPLTNSLMSCL